MSPAASLWKSDALCRARFLAFALLLALACAASARAADVVITKADPYDTPDGKRTVDLVIASTRATKIDHTRLSVTVNFYEKTAQGVQEAINIHSTTTWLSAPAGKAAANASETLQIEWPAVNPHPGGGPLGLVLGIYYRGELQATWSFPTQLAKTFPLPPRE